MRWPDNVAEYSASPSRGLNKVVDGFRLRLFFMDMSKGLNIKSIRRKVFMNIASDKGLVKAVALAVFIKTRYASSCIRNFSYRKLRDMSGLHDVTLKKRIAKLEEYGFIKRVGRHGEHLIIGSMSSHNNRRNIDISCIDFSTIKDIEKSILSLVVVEMQKRKNFVKHILNCVREPKDTAEYKWAKRQCRDYGYEGEYKEYGISYKRIAKEMGVCLQKAFGVVKYAVTKGFLTVEKRQEQLFVRGAIAMSKYSDRKGYTFATRNNVYKIYANVYSLGPRIIAGLY